MPNDVGRSYNGGLKLHLGGVNGANKAGLDEVREENVSTVDVSNFITKDDLQRSEDRATKAIESLESRLFQQMGAMESRIIQKMEHIDSESRADARSVNDRIDKLQESMNSRFDKSHDLAKGFASKETVKWAVISILIFMTFLVIIACLYLHYTDADKIKSLIDHAVKIAIDEAAEKIKASK